MDKVNATYGTSIQIEKIAVSIIGNVSIKEVLIEDYRQDSLFYAKNIKTNIIDINDWTQGKLRFDRLTIDDFQMKLILYKGEKVNNLDRFVTAFKKKNKKKKSSFLLTVQEANLNRSGFSYYDYNKEKPRIVDFYNIKGHTTNLLIQGANFSTDVKSLAFDDFRGLHVDNVKAKYSYTLEKMDITDITLHTKTSKVKGDVIMTYDRKDFSDFNNKVVFSADLKDSKISSEDLKHYYKEFESGQEFYFNTKANGVLNDLTFYQLDLEGKQKMDIIGTLNFKNFFGKKHQPFSMKGDLKKVTTNYSNLVNLFPKLLGERLPPSLDKLKNTTFRGTVDVTRQSIIAHVVAHTGLGEMAGDFVIKGFNSKKVPMYDGILELEFFDMGELLSNDKLGKVTASIDVKGKGFTEESLNTHLKGVINSVYFNKYDYKNITLDGYFKKPLFEGLAAIDDPNLKMNFDGLVNFKETENEYLFKSKIDYANLYNIKLSTKDTISLLKGDLDINLKGTTVDDVSGKISFNNGIYINPIQEYKFNDFEITSHFDQNKERTITVNSPDIIEGKMKGKFRFSDYRKVVENSLGSMYTHYKPHVLKEDQYVSFHFNIYNQIVDIFFPEIHLGNNTFIKGNISTADNDFKLDFQSPDIVAYSKTFFNPSLVIDNKSTVYNASVTFDSLQSRSYTISKFSLTNKTRNDTLFVQSNFNGGKKDRDSFEFKLFHTLNENNQSVVGFNPSVIDFKSYKWQINEENNASQTVVFDKTLNHFIINKIAIQHDSIQAQINGVIKDSTYKDVKVAFKDVPVNKITPSIKNLIFEGRLNGVINIFQEKGLYQPEASLFVDDFILNNHDLGRFMATISGTPDLKYFEIGSKITSGGSDLLVAKGGITMDVNPKLDLDVKFDQFNLETLSPLGGTIITNIKGMLSGRMGFNGLLLAPEVNGRFYVNDGGLTVPYLNVDYLFKENSIVDVTEQQFIFKEAYFTDKKFKTIGRLEGFAGHTAFADWILDLKLKGDKLLVLDTEDSDESVYYGKAFVDGNATIKGPTNALVMKVKAKSKKGTEIKIPINDSESLGDNTFITFISPSEKNKKQVLKTTKKLREYKGFEMAFDFDITPDATIEVIIDRESGHGIKGKGFGNILLDINTLGKFNMWGDFIAHEGLYHFKYGGLIDKKFEVSNNSTIRWEGDPFRAILNLEAVYKTQANPSVLIENATFNRTVPVDVKIKLTDQLIKPEVDFEIDFPTMSTIQKSEIQFTLSEKNERQKQALYLLSSGGFLSATDGGQNAVTGNLFERASSLINGALVDEDSKLKVDLNYVQRNNTALIQTEGRVGLTFKSPINDRVTINGKFGVPTGVSQSSVIGEASIDWRLSEDDSVYASFFNKENDIYYFGETIGYTQGIGLSYKVDFNSFKSFINKVKSQSKKKPKQEKEIKADDSYVKPKKTSENIEKTSTEDLYRNNIPELD